MIRLVCCHGNRTATTPYEPIVIDNGIYWHRGCLKAHSGRNGRVCFKNSTEVEKINAESSAAKRELLLLKSIDGRKLSAIIERTRKKLNQK